MVDMTNEEITLCAEIARLRATNAALLKALKDIELASDVNKYFHVRNIARASIQQAESAS